MCINLIALPTRPFYTLQLTAFTAISIPYHSDSFSAANAYLSCPNPIQCILPHLSIFPYSCSLATYISIPAPFLLTSYFALSTLISYSIRHYGSQWPYWQLTTRHACYQWNLGPYHTSRTDQFNISWLLFFLCSSYLCSPSVKKSPSPGGTAFLQK